MKTYIILIAIFALFSISSYSQSLSTKKAAELQGTIYNFFYDSNGESNTNRKQGPSEAFLCFLEVDSTGKISSVCLLSDEKNRDSAYFILSKLQPGHFKTWQSEDCKGKTIMIPLLLIGPEDSPKYVRKIYPFRMLQKGEFKDLIVIGGIDFIWPYTKHRTTSR